MKYFSINGREVEWDVRTGLLNATHFVSLFDSSFNLSAYFSGKGVKGHIERLEDVVGNKVVVIERGRNAGTWIHPLLIVNLALVMDKSFKPEEEEWLGEVLDSLRKECKSNYLHETLVGMLYLYSSKERGFGKQLERLDGLIKKICNVTDWNSAGRGEFSLRDSIYRNIIETLPLLDNVRVSIKISIKNIKH